MSDHEYDLYDHLDDYPDEQLDEQLDARLRKQKWQKIQLVKLCHFCSIAADHLHGHRLLQLEDIPKHPRGVASWGALWLKPHWELTYQTAKVPFKFLRIEENVDVELYPLTSSGEKGALHFRGNAESLINQGKSIFLQLRADPVSYNLLMKSRDISEKTIKKPGWEGHELEGGEVKRIVVTFEDLANEFNEQLSRLYDEIAGL